MSIIFRTLVFLNFYSAISIYPNSLIEHYPYGIMLATIAMLYRMKVEKTLLIPFFLIIVYIGTLLLVSNITTKMWVLPISYINFISPIFFIKLLDTEDLIKPVYVVYFLSILIGFLQFFNILDFLGVNLEDLIARFNSSEVSNEIGGYRGVSLLATEPARASYIFFCSAVILFHYTRNIAYVFVAISIDFLLIRSATGFILYGVFFTFILLKSKYKVSGLVFASIIAFFLVTFPGLFLHNESKVFMMIQALTNDGVLVVSKMLVEFSGGRVGGIVNGLIVFISNPFGGFAFSDVLIEGWKFMEGDFNSKYIVSHTPISGFITFSCMFGIVFLIQLHQAIKKPLSNRDYNKTIFFAVSSALFFYSPPGMSLSVLTLLLIIYTSPIRNEI